MALASGTRLGPYEIVERLGAGGMGEVYRARDPRLSREVAVKLISTDGATSPDRLRRFETEARAAAQPEPSREGRDHHHEDGHGMIDAAAGSGGRLKER